MGWVNRSVFLVGPLLSAILILLVHAAVDDSSTWKLLATVACLLPCCIPWKRLMSRAIGLGNGRNNASLLSWIDALDLSPQQLEIRQQSETMLREIEERAEELTRRELELVAMRMTAQELVEYPAQGTSPDQLLLQDQAKLYRLDVQVRGILEAEAERVYEKVREDGYLVDGRICLPLIRDEVLELIRRIGWVYRPDSADPLQEVSVEQSCRAAGRVCLQFLVLLEQLPLPVESMSVGAVYRWIRRGVVAFGVYRSAAPWMKSISRGLYAGRLVSAVSPVSVGVWWLASELGRKGAQRLVQSTVDRQGVAVLQQLVSLIGMEAAAVFGPGFRQRDPAWAHGVELLHLITALEDSGERLRAGLRRVTSLPLLSEYDRVYLYRSLANRQKTELPDSAPEMLNTEQRESIAAMLEGFVGDHCGPRDEIQVRSWRTGAEDRLGLRLRIQLEGETPRRSDAEQMLDAATFLLFFRRRICNASAAEIRSDLLRFETCQRLSPEKRIEILAADQDLLERDLPDLNPDGEICRLLTEDLARSVAMAGQLPSETETGFREATAWFRRTSAAASDLLEQAFAARIQELQLDREMAVGRETLRAVNLFRVLKSGEHPVCCYEGLRRRVEGEEIPLAGQLLGLKHGDGVRFVVVENGTGQVVWANDQALHITRCRTLLADYAEISNGAWNPDSQLTGVLQIAGSFRRGGFEACFAPLLQNATCVDRVE